MEKLGKHEKLFHLYEILTQLAQYEGRLVVERTNVFLLANSILFTGFVLAEKLRELWFFAFGVPSVGILLCILHTIAGWRNINAQSFWLNSIALIEEEDLFQDLRGLGLTVWTTHHRYHNNEDVRQFTTQNVACILPKMSRWRKLCCFGPLDPSQIHVFWIPLLFYSLWLGSIYYFAVSRLTPSLVGLFWVIGVLILLALICLSSPYLLAFGQFGKKFRLLAARVKKLVK